MPVVDKNLTVAESIAPVLAPVHVLEKAAAVIATTTAADAIVETVEIEAVVEIAIVATVDEITAETEMAVAAVEETETEVGETT